MGKTLPLHRLVTLGLSCLIHLGLVAGIIAVGRDLVAGSRSSVVMAELVPAEPPRPVEPVKPVAAKPKPGRPKPEKLTPPKPVATPMAQSVPEAEPESPPAPPPPIAAEPTPPVRERDAGFTARPPASFAAATTGDFTVPDTPAGSDQRGLAAPSSAPPSTAMAIPRDGITQTAIPRGGYQVRPSYPSGPRRLGIQGTTTLRIYVATDGRVTEIAVEQSAGHPDLDHAAADAVKRWSFEPARRGAEAVGMWVLLPVEFRLR
jgi:protein TonB